MKDHDPKRRTQISYKWLIYKVEATPGIEPGYTVLQTVA
jgi:hypothetical protein